MSNYLIMATGKGKKNEGLFLLSVLILSLLCTLVTGCAKHERPRTGPLIGVIFRASYGSYTGEIERGIRDKARNLGANLQVSFHDQADDSELPDTIDENIIKNFKMLLLFPESKGGAVKHCIPVILQAHRKNLPVILLHSGIDEKKVRESGAQVRCLVTCDNVGGGKMAARFFAKGLKGRGKIVLMEGLEKSYTGELRKKGFLEIMKNYRDINVMMATPALNDKSQAFFATRKLIATHKDIGGIFTLNGPMALGVSEAVVFSKINRPLIVSFDGSNDGIKAVKEGKIDATVTQSAYEIGQRGLECAVKLLNGQDIPSHVQVPAELLTKEDLKRRESR